MYVALILDQESNQKLENAFKDKFPIDWKILCHHMTINMGDEKKSPAIHMIGQTKELKAVSFAQDGRVCAVGVETDVPSTNEKKHVTVAVNILEGGKPFHSNLLITWTPLENPITLKGTISIVG